PRGRPPPPPRPPPPSGLPEPLLRDLDVTLWLAGRFPERVYAVGQSGDGCYAQLHLGFPGGGMALLDYTDRLPPGDGYQSLSVIASRGAASADDQANVQLLYRGGRPRALPAPERSGLLAAVAQDFVDALRGNRLSSGAIEWRNVFTVAAAARQSFASGQAVTPEGG